jgi:NDP-sugar pyrophosphorylase family protein
LIVAGGMATRLLPITKKIPKSLIKINGSPFIYHQMDYLKQQGVKEVVICIGFLGELIMHVIGTGSKWGIKVTYSSDGASVLGTGGAIKKALPYLGEHFFLLYGDSYLPIDYSIIEKAYFNSKKKAIMTVFKNSNRWDKSNVIFHKGKLIKYDKHNHSIKMKHIDYGLSILNKKIFVTYKKKENFDLSEIYIDLSNNNELAGFEIYNRFYEIGSHEGIEEFQDYLKERKDC